ncbi:MBL fold metallo-hydrolase [Natronorubrum sp. FCH18a]|uniref:MBL fold metallo-hydrolase n=1 Tax=Natronorubrum sp. FCH18a TaxID=3447018 RepID=UPI003F50F56F
MADTDAGDSDGFCVTALGTGASTLDNERASVGYVVRVDGDPALLVDAGGGTAARLSDARIDLTAVDAVFLGHLHVDHTADFPAVVKAAYQQGRGDRPLAVYGPAGTPEHPGTETWLSRLFDEETGAYGYLSDFVERYADGELDLPVTEVDAIPGENDDAVRIYERDGLTVDAIPVVHGEIPTLAYRVAYDGRSFTFTGDYAAETGNVPRIARQTDVLVHHRLLEDDAEGPKTDLHPSASECGRNAREAGVGTLVLSHIGRDDPDDLETALETVRDEYDGRIVVLRDLLDVYPDGTVVDTRENRMNGRTGHLEVTNLGPGIVVLDECSEP